MIGRIEGIHNGSVLVVFDHAFKTITVSDCCTGEYRSFHEHADIYELWQSFEANFNEHIKYREACLFFKTDLIK